MFSFKIDCGSLLSKLDKLAANLPVAVFDALQECGDLVAKEESQRTKGKMAQSFITYRQGNAQIIDNTKFYAKWIQFGRPAIKAKKAKALRFWIDGEIVFCKSAKAAPPQPFMMESVFAAWPKFDGIFAKHINKILK